MGQRHQYLVTLPDVIYSNANNPNNRSAETGIVHHQWLYGVNAIVTAARVLKLINRADADGLDYIFGTNNNNKRYSDDGIKAIAATMSVDPETGYYHQVHIYDKTHAPNAVESNMLDNNDGVTVIHVEKGERKPLFCFATPSHLEGQHWTERKGQGPWNASQYLAMYYTSAELSEFDEETRKALHQAIEDINNFSRPMSDTHLRALHPELRDAAVISIAEAIKALPALPELAPEVLPSDVIDVDGAQIAIVKGESISILGGEYAKRNTWKIGDVAVYDSYNLVYTGIITAIGAKTVTIEAYKGSDMAKNHRLSLVKFVQKNRSFDLESIRKRNSEWTD